MVRVGGLDESPGDILDRAKIYLQSPDASPPFAYPWYDGYDTGARESELVDGDLLAPLLLNAAPDLAAYRTIESWRPKLNEALKQVAEVASVGHFDAVAAAEWPSEWPEMDGAIGKLYQVLDDERGSHVSGTTLSKVLHRKMPAHIPLYDSKIFWAYCSAPAVRIHPDPHRKISWVEFMSLLAHEIRRDMTEPDAAPLIDEVRGLASSEQPITALRAWDIITWQAAREALQQNWPLSTT